MACCTAHKRKRLLRQIKGFLRSIFLNIKSGPDFTGLLFGISFLIKGSLLLPP